MSKSIMVQGTMSNSGKSFLVAGLCRIFKQDGYKVVPFKSQNMSLNSFVTKDGKEMGRAQVMQAEASGVLPDIRMNPILLKPIGDKSSQVIINGKSIGNMGAVNYFEYRHNFIDDIKKSYNSLSLENDIIVIEGAGSPAEINLKENDIVNMGMAEIADSNVIVVGDIDRGGVFASLYGTIALLNEDERKRVKGLVINKFRGDINILNPGLKQLEELTGIPVIGVIPYINIDIDDEDSLADRLIYKKRDIINIAVINFPKMSNFTDFMPFERINGVAVNYVTRHNELDNADLIILPGSKNTIEDLLWIRQNGIEAKIKKLYEQELPIIGICGGYQMLGKSLCDELGVENGLTTEGIGLLNIKTVFKEEKTTKQVKGKFIENTIFDIKDIEFFGYEIHMGETTLVDGDYLTLVENKNEGAINNNCFGTYVHGIFDNTELANKVVKKLFENKGLNFNEDNTLSDYEYKEKQYEILGNTIRNSLDIHKLYEILK